MPSADELLDVIYMAMDPNATNRGQYAVDGAVADPTLDQVAVIAGKSAPPPGQEGKGDGLLTLSLDNLTVQGNHAQGDLHLIWPGEWGRWDYPGSGFQYVDGQWKMEKSTVCNLAKMAWIECY